MYILYAYRTLHAYSRTCLVSTSKVVQNQYFLSEVLTVRTDLCTVCIGENRMKSTYYPGVRAKPDTY